MSTATATPVAKASSSIQTLNVRKEIQIAAPIDIVFETVLEPQDRLTEMNLKLEAWPGGRWYRDLGNNTGHLWGHVQVIKPPKLLEITGPMMMSYPVASFIQYRLTEEDGGTKLSFVHQAIGLIAPEHLEGLNKGWGDIMNTIKTAAEAKRGTR
ncbi:MAG TPA: SRPBCC domain-containing protein [Pirellulales bacterium]|jgi:uncharacterized protein YndB with AHSA1/START domain|nr:SRPBCC domain-containing protein [Pirellulales bacterium]